MPPTIKLHALRLAAVLFVLAAAPFGDLWGLRPSNLVALAQSSTGTVSGLAVDEHGDVVPGVEMTLTNEETGLRKQQATDGDGGFVFVLLPPGLYNLQAQRAGFATVTYKRVQVNVGDRKGLRVLLKAGQVAESVTVEEAPLVQTERSAVSTLVNRQFVENMPLNGRSFNALIELTPGSVLTVADALEPGQFSVNGQRPNANYFTVDGVGANVGIGAGVNPSQQAAGTVPVYTTFGGTNGLVSVDALQEFRVQTSMYAAEFGRMPGAQVSVVTRSGTNEFHGTLFEYLRNEALDANDWFANSLGLDKPQMRQNDFGGVLGGPVSHDQTFFFFSYEGLRLRLPQVVTREVPTLAARQSAIPAMRPILDAFPLPNGRDLGNRLAQASASLSSPRTLDAVSLRVDHVVNDRVSVFGRFNHALSELSIRSSFGGASLGEVTYGTTVPTTLTVGSTQVFGANVANDLRANYSRVRATASYSLDDFGGAAPPAPETFFPASAASGPALAQFVVGPGLLLSGTNAENYQRQVNLVDNLSVVRGAHQLRFGADYRRLTPVSGPREYQIFARFNTLSDALAGRASVVTIASALGRVYPVFHNFSAYAQDTWRASRRLTLNYGVRWELNPPPREAKGRDAFTVVGLEDPATMTLAPEGTPLWETTYGNWAPRIGAAYLLTQGAGRETVLRGGIGIFYDLGTGTSGDAIFGANYPHSSTKVLTNVQFPLTPEQLAPLPFSMNPPYPLLTIADPHLVLPRTYQWSLGVERSLGVGQTFSASYVGAAGRKLIRQERVTSADFSDLRVARNSATSDYHAMQLQFERRLARGLQALASYTWSHSIDIVSYETLTSVAGARIDQRIDRGPSDFDVRHSLSAAATYNLPRWGANEISRAIFGGWSLDAMLRARSATPVNVIIGRPLFGVPGVTRVDFVPGVPLYIKDPNAPGGRVINRAAFVIPSVGRQGTLGRNSLRGFPVSQTDLAVRRQFGLTEGLLLQLRGEVFNIFNHPNFGAPVPFLPQPTFGRSTSMLSSSQGFDAGLSPLYQIGGPRSIQLALKLLF
jgi:hypothetical protein